MKSETAIEQDNSRHERNEASAESIEKAIRRLRIVSYSLMALLIVLAPITFSLLKMRIAENKRLQEEKAVAMANGDDPLRLAPRQKTIPFTLTAQNNQPFSSESLKGKVWVAEFFFASCESSCPRLQTQMKKVQQAFADNPQVEIVAFTVDPKRDTPEKLAAYAKKWDAIPGKWHFLTGDKPLIYRLGRESFQVMVSEKTPENPGSDEDFIHSSQFFLVDRNGVVRGNYPGEGQIPQAIDELVADANTLLKEK